MNRREIKQRINRAVRQITPNVYDDVATVPVRKMAAHDHITRQELPGERSRSVRMFGFAPAFASLAVLFIAIFAWWQFLRIDSVVAVDVNPSIELKLNRLSHVVAVQAYNPEAQSLVEAVPWRFSPVEDVIQRLLGAMKQQGYLQSENSFLMLSYQQDNQSRAEALSRRLNKAVLRLKLQNPEMVYVQRVEIKEIAGLADDYDVSRGVMQLILKAQIMNPQYSVELLSELDLQTLYWLSENKMQSAPESTAPSPTPMPVTFPTPEPTLGILSTPRSWEYLCWEEDDDEYEWDDDCWEDLWEYCGKNGRLNDDCVQRIVDACWDGEELDDDCFDD
ncbi:MAG TPA: hypothetical protein PK381_02825 [Anaerolineaceae bacterium]|nr:hypothetical protein [Anaerolineaceae bacterium]